MPDTKCNGYKKYGITKKHIKIRIGELMKPQKLLAEMFIEALPLTQTFVL